MAYDRLQALAAALFVTQQVVEILNKAIANQQEFSVDITPAAAEAGVVIHIVVRPKSLE